MKQNATSDRAHAGTFGAQRQMPDATPMAHLMQQPGLSGGRHGAGDPLTRGSSSRLLAVGVSARPRATNGRTTNGYPPRCRAYACTASSRTPLVKGSIRVFSRQTGRDKLHDVRWGQLQLSPSQQLRSGPHPCPGARYPAAPSGRTRARGCTRRFRAFSRLAGSVFCGPQKRLSHLRGIRL